MTRTNIDTLRVEAREGHVETMERLVNLQVGISNLSELVRTPNSESASKHCPVYVVLRLTLVAAELRERVIHWIAPPNITAVHHEAACRTREAGTGNWFLEGETYHDWKTGQIPFLWLHGIPGCGKSVLWYVDEMNGLHLQIETTPN